LLIAADMIDINIGLTLTYIHQHINSLCLLQRTLSQRLCVFRLSHCLIYLSVCSSIRSARQILLPQYLIDGFNDFDKTDNEWPLAPTDDLIRFWRSKIKVIAANQGQILWTPYLLHYVSSLDETYRE